mgnify:CR=1 FL=1
MSLIQIYPGPGFGRLLDHAPRAVSRNAPEQSLAQSALALSIGLFPIMPLNVENLNMNTDLTDITLVVDRSGSMEAVREDAEGGINSFIKGQAGEPGEALLTLVQFDTEYEFVHRGIPIQEVPRYSLEPRGMTALLDAMGRAIEETGSRLAAMEESERPGLVIFVVMTDGHENSSRAFTKEQSRRMTEHQRTVYNWQFTYLGANQDSFAEAGSMGFNRSGVADFDIKKVEGAYGATMSKVARMRSQLRNGQTVDNRFSAEEREQMK